MSTTADTASELRPFRVDMADEAIADLQGRVAATRRPSRELVADRSQGVQLATIQELARYWTTDYDWHACEAKLNALPQFKTEIDGVDIHFIHVKSPEAGALPLIMTHGWPGSVIELLDVVGPLTDPTARRADRNPHELAGDGAGRRRLASGNREGTRGARADQDIPDERLRLLP
jgi:hypothetical protein